MPKELIPENIVFRYPEDASDEDKKKIREEGLEMQGELDLKEFPELNSEVEKEEWQQEIIEKVNREIVKYFKEELDLSVEPFKSKNIHILPPEKLLEMMSKLGREDMPQEFRGTAFKNNILLSSDLNSDPHPKFEFTRVLIHEYLHKGAFRKYARMPIGPSWMNMEGVMPEREGLANVKRGTYPLKWRFKAIDEGLTELLAKKILHNVVDGNEMFREELNKRFTKVDKKISRDRLFETWGVNAYDIEDLETIRDGEDTIFEWTRVGVYKDEQDLIMLLAREIKNAHPEKYKNIDECIMTFLKAQNRGELLPMSKDIDTTFGKGTFRLLASIRTMYNNEGRNDIARNAITYLRLPPERRRLEDAKQYIFGEYYADEYEKYLAQRNQEEKKSK